jgi:hypothetical protein
MVMDKATLEARIERTKSYIKEAEESRDSKKLNGAKILAGKVMEMADMLEHHRTAITGWQKRRGQYERLLAKLNCADGAVVHGAP